MNDYVQDFISDGVKPVDYHLLETPHQVVPENTEGQQSLSSDAIVVPPTSAWDLADKVTSADAIDQAQYFGGDIEKFKAAKSYDVFGYNPNLPSVKSDSGKLYDANEVKYQQAQTFGDVMSNAVGQNIGLAWNSFKGSFQSDANTLNALFDFSGTDYFKGFKERFLGSPEELLENDKQQKAIMNKYAIFSSPETEGVFNKEFLGDAIGQLGFTLGTMGALALETVLTAGLADAIAPMAKSVQLAKYGRGLEVAEQAGINLERGAARTLAQDANSLSTNAQRINDIRSQGDIAKNRNYMKTLWEKTGIGSAASEFSYAKVGGATTTQAIAASFPSMVKSYTMFNAAKSEAAMEASSTYGQLYMNLINKYEEKNGQLPTGKALEDITTAAYGAATDNFIVNTGLLMVMNDLEFGGMMNKFSSTKRLYREAAVATTEGEGLALTTVKGIVKEGAPDVVKGMVGKESTLIYKMGKFGALGNFNPIRKDFGLGTALWQTTKGLAKSRAAKFEFLEGLQEILQSSSNETFRDYYTNLYNANKDLNGNFLKDFTDADWKKGLATQMNMEGWKTFLMGATTGMFLSPLTAAGMYGRHKGLMAVSDQYKSDANAKELVNATNYDLLNSFYRNSAGQTFAENVAGFKNLSYAAKGMSESVPNSDKYHFHNYQNDTFAKTAAVAIKTGNIESFIDTVKSLGDGRFTDEEFMQAMGLETTNGEKINTKEYVNIAAKEIEQYYINWKNLQDKYSDIVIPELTKDPTKLFEAQQQRAAIQDAIEMLAIPNYHIQKTLERAVAIQAKMSDPATMGDIAGSVSYSFDVLKSEVSTQLERISLEKEIESYTGLNDKDSNDARKNKEEQLKSLNEWQVAYKVYSAIVSTSQEEGLTEDDKQVLSDTKADVLEGLLNSFEKYIKSHNSVNNTSPQNISRLQLLDAFEGLSDFIVLNRDHDQYTAALNILSTPTNFLNNWRRIKFAKVMATDNAIKEAKEDVEARTEATFGKDVPTEEETVPEDIVETSSIEESKPVEKVFDVQSWVSNNWDEAWESPLFKVEDLSIDDFVGSRIRTEFKKNEEAIKEEIKNRLNNVVSEIEVEPVVEPEPIITPEPVIVESALPDNIPQDKKINKLHDQVTPYYTIDDKQLNDLLKDVTPTNYADRFSIRIYKNRYEVAPYIVGGKNWWGVRNAVTDELFKKKGQDGLYEDRDLAEKALLEKVNATSPFWLDGSIKQNKEEFAIEIFSKQLNKVIGFIPSGPKYSFTKQDGTFTTLPKDANELAKVVDIRDKDRTVVYNDWKVDYEKSIALNLLASRLLTGSIKTIIELKGTQLLDILLLSVIQPVYGWKFTDRPTEVGDSLQQIQDKGATIVEVYRNDIRIFNILDNFKDVDKQKAAEEKIESAKNELIINNTANANEKLEKPNRALIRLKNGSYRWIDIKAPSVVTSSIKDKLDFSNVIADIVELTGTHRGEVKDWKDLNDKLDNYKINLGQGKGYVYLKVAGVTINSTKDTPTITVKIPNSKKESPWNPILRPITSEEDFIDAINEILEEAGMDVVVSSKNITKNIPLTDYTMSDIMGMQTSVNIGNLKVSWDIKDIVQATLLVPVVPVVIPTEEPPVQGGGTYNADNTQEREGTRLFPVEDKELTREEKKKAIAKKLKDKNNGIVESKKVLQPSAGFNQQSLENIDKFTQWVKDNLPEDLISVEDLGLLQDNLLANNITVGSFLTKLSALQQVEGVIQVYKDSPFKYHEAFHAIFRLLLPQQRIEQLLAIAEKEYPITQKGLQELRELDSLYTTMSEKELKERYLEEYLADKFDAWMTDRSIKTSSLNKGFFAKILDWIKSIFNRLTSSKIEGLFNEIGKGNYKNANLQHNQFTDVNNFSFNTPALKAIKVGLIDTNRKDENGNTIYIPRYLSQQDGLILSNTVAALYHQEAQLLGQHDKNELLDSILDKYANMLNPFEKDGEILKDRYFDKVEELGEESIAAEQWIQKLQDRYRVFSEKEGRNAIKESVDEQLRILGYRQSLDDDQLSLQEDEEGPKHVFDAAPDALGGISALGKDLKAYIGSTIIEYKDEFGNTHFEDDTPLMQAISADYVYNGLLKGLANSTSMLDIINKLKLYKDDTSNPTRSAFITKLFEDTGYQEEENGYGTVVIDPTLFMQVIKSFNLFSTNPLFIAVDPTGNKTKGYEVSKQSTVSEQFNEWQQSFGDMFLKGLPATNRKSYIDAAVKPLREILETFTEQTKEKKINADDLKRKSQQWSTQIKNKLGINLHPSYIAYSIIKEKNARTIDQEQLLSSLPDIDALNYAEISGIISGLQSTDSNIFVEDTDETGFNTSGAVARLNRIAKANAEFDESINTTSYIGPSGEVQYGYQAPNFHIQKVMLLNEPVYLQGLKEDKDYNDSFLLQDDKFKIMSTQKRLKVEQASGLKVEHLGEKGEDLLEQDDKYLRENKQPGDAFGQFNERSLATFILSQYFIDGGKINAGKNSFYTAPVVIRNLAEKNTSHLVRLPIIAAVKNGQLSEEGVNQLYKIVQDEFNRIKEVKEEINSLRPEQWVLGYHTGDKRGLKFDNAQFLLGDLKEQLENAANGFIVNSVDEKEELASDYTLDEKAIKEQLQNYYQQELQKAIDKLNELGLIQGETNVLLPQQLFTGFTNDTRNTAMNLSKDFKDNLGQIIMNDLINTLGFTKLLYGNEAKMFKSPTDKNKRATFFAGNGQSIAAPFTAPELGIETPLTHFHHITLKGIKYKKIDGTEGDKADGQMYSTEKGYRYTLFGLGKLTKVQADILDKLKNGTEVTPDEIFGAGGLVSKGEMFNAKKLVFFDEGVGLKCSMLPIFKEECGYTDSNGKFHLYAGMEEKNALREKMEAFEEANDTIVFAHDQSVSKTLQQNVVDFVNDIQDTHFMKRDANYMRLQLENPSNKLSMTDPTQMRLQITAEQAENNKVLYNGKETKIGDVIKQYNKDIAQRLTNNYESAANQIFSLDNALIEIDKSLKGKKITPILGKLYDILKDNLLATGGDQQTLEFLTVDENGDPVYDLNFPATLQKYTQMFLNYFSKGVMSEKTPGITVALASDWGTRRIKEVHTVWKAGDKGLISDDYIGQPKSWTVIRRDQEKANPGKYTGYHTFSGNKLDRKFTGLQEALETGKPVYILDDLRHNFALYDSNGEEIPGSRRSEYITAPHYKEQMSSWQKTLEAGYGIRIPSDDKHSSINLVLVDLLPAALGSTGIFPQELLEISGADFDIDKLFISIMDTYKEQGKRIAYGTATTDEGKFKEYIQYQLDNNKNFKKLVFGDKLFSAEEFIQATLGKDTFGYRIEQSLKQLKMPSTIEEFVKETKRKGELNNGVLNNNVLNAKLVLLGNEYISGKESKDVQAILNRSTSTDPLKDLVKNLTTLFTGKEGAGVKDILDLFTKENTDVNTIIGKLTHFINSKEGSRNIGPAVNAMLNLSLLGQNKVKITNDIINFDGKDYNSFADFTTKDGIRKFASISALVNAMTDNSKDPLAAKLGLNIEAVGLVALMVSQGINLDSAVLYMLQPAVRNYYKEINNLGGVIKTPEEQTTYKTLLLQERINEYGELKHKNITYKDLVDNIANNGENPQVQLSILQDLQKIKKQADEARNLSSILKLSQGLPSSHEEVDELVEKLAQLGIVNGKAVPEEEFAKLKLPFDARKALLGNPIYNTYIKMLGQINELAKTVFIEKTPLFKEMQDVVKSNFRTLLPREVGEFDKILKNDLISFLSIKAYKKWLNDRTDVETLSSMNNGLIYNSVYKNQPEGFEDIYDVITRLRKELIGIDENYLVSKFLRLSIFNKKGEGSDIVLLLANSFARLSDQQQQKIQQSYIDLYSHEKVQVRQDAVALFNYLLVKDGGQFKANSFIRYIAPFAFKDLSDRVKEVNQLLYKNEGLKKVQKDYQKVFGETYEQVINNFMEGYSTYVGNSSFIKVIEYSTRVNQPSMALRPMTYKDGKLVVNVFNGIRNTPETFINSAGVTISGIKGGKFSKEEKEHLKENMFILKSNGFAISLVEEGEKMRRKVEFPYTIKHLGNLYKLTGVGKEGGKGDINSLLQEGETIPQGVYAVYEPVEYTGNFQQWGGAHVFGYVPTLSEQRNQELRKDEVDNPSYAPSVPEGKKTPISSKVASIEGNKPDIKTLKDTGIQTMGYIQEGNDTKLVVVFTDGYYEEASAGVTNYQQLEQYIKGENTVNSTNLDKVIQFEEKWDKLAKEDKPDSEFINLLISYNYNSNDIDKGYNAVIDRLKREENSRKIGQDIVSLGKEKQILKEALKTDVSLPLIAGMFTREQLVELHKNSTSNLSLEEYQNQVENYAMEMHYRFNQEDINCI